MQAWHEDKYGWSTVVSEKQLTLMNKMVISRSERKYMQPLHLWADVAFDKKKNGKLAFPVLYFRN